GPQLAVLTPSGNALSSQVTYTASNVTIVDGDSATVSFQSATLAAPEAGGAVNPVLVLSTAAGDTLESNATLTVTAANGTAGNADYDAGSFSKTVTFLAGQGNGATQTVSFTPTADTLVEGDETVTLGLANGALLTGSGQTSQLVTIKDANSASVVVVSGQSVTEDGGAQPISVRLVTSGGEDDTKH